MLLTLIPRSSALDFVQSGQYCPSWTNLSGLDNFSDFSVGFSLPNLLPSDPFWTVWTIFEHVEVEQDEI